jgi:hypothetical protein
VISIHNASGSFIFRKSRLEGEGLITCFISLGFISSSNLDPSSLNFLKLPILPDIFIPPKFYGSQEYNAYVKELAECRGNQDDRARHASLIHTHRSPQVAPHPENGRHHAGIQIAIDNPPLDL